MSTSLSKRFTGGAELLCKVDVKGLAKWLGALGVSDWPDGWSVQGRPYVMVDPFWQCWMAETDTLVEKLLGNFPGCSERDRALTTVHPGVMVPPHVDKMTYDWITRVHVPMLTNPLSVFGFGKAELKMQVGNAYRVNPEVLHWITNLGDKPRVHLMFDVRRP